MDALLHNLGLGFWTAALVNLGIICAMAEVIWIGNQEMDGTQPAGLRFLK